VPILSDLLKSLPSPCRKTSALWRSDIAVLEGIRGIAIS
jgi:hypothetical protein